MMSEIEKGKKSGFIYIWFDRKHKRFYVGSHWGSPNDGYICSSNWMRDSYRRRPQDFKRRIIETVHTTRDDLYEREFVWLSLIKPHELGKRYYNLIKYRHGSIQYTDAMREKMAAVNRGKKHSPETITKRSASLKATYNTPKKKLEQSERAKEIWDNPEHREFMSDSMVQRWKSDEHREKIIPKLLEAANREETKQKISDASKKKWQDPEFRKRHSESIKDRIYPTRSEEQRIANSIRSKELWKSEEYRQKMSEAHLNSDVARESSKKNIRKTHTPEAIEASKAKRKANRDAADAARKLDPVSDALYRKERSEAAKLMAQKRWHPELFT